MSGRDRREPSGGALFAGGIGAVIACCAVPILIAVGVIAGLSGLVLGGLVLGFGAVVAAVAWLIAWRLDKRRACRTAPDRTERQRTER